MVKLASFYDPDGNPFVLAQSLKQLSAPVPETLWRG